MKTRILFLLIPIWLVFYACTHSEEEGYAPGEKETVVEMTFLNTAHTRVLTPGELEDIIQGTEDERRINTLDLFVFKNEEFQYRRNAVKSGSDIDNIFRATLKVDDGLTVYFVANARELIDRLVREGQIVDESLVDWESIREKLIDDHPLRFATNGSERRNLPMFGVKSGLNVTGASIAHWTGINLLRAVAGVDIYLDKTVDNFMFHNARLYFVPDKGNWAPSSGNYQPGGDILSSESAAGMYTSLTLGPVDANDGKVANQFYLYDNDTDESNYVGGGSQIRRYTRLVVGGVYQSQTYYYPVDFLVEHGTDGSIGYDKIVRNTKYIFQITEVSGPGYPTPEIASQEPPVHMTTHVYNWNIHDDKHVGYDGTYYISLDRKSAVLSRPEGSNDQVNFTTNALPHIVTLNFTTDKNGLQVALPSGSGIVNDRFSVEVVCDDNSANITNLRFAALGDYDPAASHRNMDAVVVRAGNVQFTISITQLNGSTGDWESGGEEETELEGMAGR